jgi:hypothetical protein
LCRIGRLRGSAPAARVNQFIRGNAEKLHPPFKVPRRITMATPHPGKEE